MRSGELTGSLADEELCVLAAVGQLGILASVEPQPGMLFFTAVLLCTLFAADLYEPRMIWRPQPNR